MTTECAHYRRSPGVVSADVEGSLVLLSRTMEFLEIDRTGSVIWEALEVHSTAEAIAERLTARYDVGAAEALADTERFIGQLHEHDLVTRDPA